MNIRTVTGALTHTEVGHIMHVWHHARRIGLPLAVMITQSPPGVDQMSPAQRMRVLRATLNAYCAFARRNGFESTYLWVREIRPEGTGEHFHILVHVPALLVHRFSKLAQARRPFPEVEARHASEYSRMDRNGRWLSALTYLVKQMTPQARWKYDLQRQPGGKVIGKRYGMAQNLMQSTQHT